MPGSLQLTAEEARAAIDEASKRAAQVRRNDRQLGWMLGAVLLVYMAAGAVISLSPHRGTTYAGAAVVLMLAVAIGAIVVIGLRIRAYSRAGLIWFFSSIIGFNLWNAAITSASIVARFWAAGQPSYHFGMSVAVGVIPLLIGSWALVTRR